MGFLAQGQDSSAQTTPTVAAPQAGHSVLCLPQPPNFYSLPSDPPLLKNLWLPRLGLLGMPGP